MKKRIELDTHVWATKYRDGWTIYHRWDGMIGWAATEKELRERFG
jgi:hypothetical protein